MKRLLKLFIILILFLPIILYASTYESSRIKAKKFITTDYSDTYQRYLIDAGNSSFDLPWSNISDDNTAYNQGNIAYGGMLTKQEYESSLGGNPRSYLFDGKQYWSMSATSEGHYVVGLGKGLDNNSSTPATKVTEYVLHDTKVTGRGTIDNPWVFVPKYSLTVTGEGGEVKPTGGRIGSSVVVNGVNDAVTFELTPNSGNNYLYNTCGLITSPSTSKEINDTNKITFRGINKDISCKIVFGKGLFELEIKQVNKTEPLEEQEKVNTTPTKIYVRNSEQFYRDEDGNNPITKLNPFVVNKRGYTFGGLYYDMPGGGRVKVVDASGNIDRLSAKNITSNGVLKPVYTALVVPTTIYANGRNKSGVDATILGQTSTVVNFTYGQPYSTFAEPILNGYTFIGWYDAASGGTKIDLSKNFYEVSDHPLFAHWTARRVTISFQGNGGTVDSSVSTGVVTYDGEYGTLPSASQVTRPGYTFDGWYTAASGGTKVTSTTPVTNATNHPLYAHWIAKTNTAYTVKHYKQNIAQNGYDLAETQNLTGTTDTSVTPAVKSYTGFTAPATQTKTIAGDGSMLIEYNYSRNSYYWDLNGTLDGTNSGNIAGYGTVDVYINGNLVANDVNDWYTSYPFGSTWSISDIRAASGKKYTGVANPSGTIGASTVDARLSFATELEQYNAYRYSSDCNLYYVTTCQANTCNYSSKNGSSASGTVSKSSLTESYPSNCIKTFKCDAYYKSRSGNTTNYTIDGDSRCAFVKATTSNGQCLPINRVTRTASNANTPMPSECSTDSVKIDWSPVAAGLYGEVYVYFNGKWAGNTNSNAASWYAVKCNFGAPSQGQICTYSDICYQDMGYLGIGMVGVCSCPTNGSPYTNRWCR